MNHVMLKTKIHNPPLQTAASCELHGAFTSRCHVGTVWTACPACAQGERDRKAREEREEAERRRRQAWQAKIDGTGIPPRFMERTLDGYRAETPEQREALAFARDFLASFDEARRTGRSALFVGRPGTGKTHLACAIGMDLLRQGRVVLYTSVIRAIRRIKDTWGRGAAETESEAIAVMVAPDLLILDEVGVQFGSDTERLLIFDLLNERYEKRRPTILMSNLTIDELAAYLGERVMDRLREDGGAVVVFDWDSYRTRGGAGAP